MWFHVGDKSVAKVTRPSAEITRWRGSHLERFGAATQQLLQIQIAGAAED